MFAKGKKKGKRREEAGLGAGRKEGKSTPQKEDRAKEKEITKALLFLGRLQSMLLKVGAPARAGKQWGARGCEVAMPPSRQEVTCELGAWQRL